MVVVATTAAGSTDRSRKNWGSIASAAFKTITVLLVSWILWRAAPIIYADASNAGRESKKEKKHCCCFCVVCVGAVEASGNTEFWYLQI